MAKSNLPVQIVYCYARKDSSLREELEEHLEFILRSGIAISWHDRKIRAGEDWQKAINNHLDQADLILLLISPSFMRSDYCYGIELQQALERQEWGLASVIPIILRPVVWQTTPLGRLQALPRDGKPVVLWGSQDEAFTQIAQEIYNVILQQLSEDRHQKEYWMRVGHSQFQSQEYSEALYSYQQAYQIDPANSLLLGRIGEIHAEAGNYDEALAIFESILQLLPDNEKAWQRKAEMLLHLQRYEEALTCYQLILSHFQVTHPSLCGKGLALFALRRYSDALSAYDDAIAIYPGDAYLYHYKSIVLIHLRKWKEAMLACEQAIHRNPFESSFYLNQARIDEQLHNEQQKDLVELSNEQQKDLVELSNEQQRGFLESKFEALQKVDLSETYLSKLAFSESVEYFRGPKPFWKKKSVRKGNKY
ncbi:hypothetical protein KSF_085090 [Reticulibacter mediterranei]|uniref:TIR domain-containing protein n=1 Tax=Reticulibacter mediterranei TaxID=2778369 RepID=A0A8J3IYN0_9CHLR|nr:toll/interleukin-1 receptor domain-containing protein [Reticulibacter mediterranei]GHO98461.1 hypothetical protein KSF_085090 [Reticulibacter mediterranei]